MLLNGLVVASYGKRYGVELEDGTELSCVTRGKKTDLACGDKVKVRLTGPGEGVVEQLEPRSSLLYRSNSFRSKMLAANVTQAVIVLATQPSFYEELLNRCLVACEAAGVKALIVLNKCDLDNANEAMLRLQDYAALGYNIQPLSARDNVAPLKPWLRGETSVLVGQSGMGKSTIVNALLPGKMVRTQEVSTVLDSGKHTTTAAHLYHLDAESKLIDSPGLQEFGLHHLNAEQLELAFVEFRPYLGKCRFNNCRHLKEPDCAIQAAVDAGDILPRRFACYQQLRQEIP
ncbi:MULTISPECIES: ribosome small subunit-dependent GTPase A [Methylobacillus]|uniref:Small ribosomal subunit biogenesis GTPase RsgA n=1 Tax=Methylobacillus flagellatus (strain ATCC 51484 / DSM 6875 / VKM B-1610 / KT) TaxID=265072 RepID=Q1H194_METFK|nr:MULTISPECIES: ribosome small subunit-dependent GTPase A [Methylobacillus]ABE49743.1 GTPase EngC [Methylobacillus flagellatus KT]MPS49021.1 ribosome small subunit-dependent GTPase A [Methylobacillus sp.]